MLLDLNEPKWASPVELGQCPHGRFYSYQWVNWETAKMPDAELNSEPEIISHGCKKCREE